jgi:hypothetical protein
VKLTKREKELRIFERLAPLIGLEVEVGSISQPDPPDILCRVIGNGPLAIELVALDSPETRSRLDNMQTTDEAWFRALAILSAQEQETIRTETQHVFFSVGFANSAGLRDRSQAMLTLQKFLLVNRGYSGALAPAKIGKPRGLDTVTIHRGKVTNGPKFSHFSAGRWQPPQTSTLEEKLKPGRYTFDGQLELFAYTVHDEPDMAVGSLERLQEVIITRLPQSSFRRVHLFDFGLGRHLFSYPEPSETLNTGWPDR